MLSHQDPLLAHPRRAQSRQGSKVVRLQPRVRFTGVNRAVSFPPARTRLSWTFISLPQLPGKGRRWVGPLRHRHPGQSGERGGVRPERRGGRRGGGYRTVTARKLRLSLLFLSCPQTVHPMFCLQFVVQVCPSSRFSVDRRAEKLAKAILQFALVQPKRRIFFLYAEIFS